MGTGAAARGPGCDANAVRLLVHVSRAAAVVAAAVGVGVLVGWVGDVAVLKSVLPQFASMKANTALSFVLLGVALFAAHAREPLRRAHRPVALVALALAALTLLQYATGIELGIDQVVFADPVATTWPGRMS